MATDHIRYDVLARDAMRDVLRRVLTDAARHGLPGDHHFYITFDSRAEGVTISPRLLAQYPEEMTVVLQHQFWDLEVDDAGVGALLLRHLSEKTHDIYSHPANSGRPGMKRYRETAPGEWEAAPEDGDWELFEAERCAGLLWVTE